MPETSTSLDRTEPNESSLRGVRIGQLATDRGGGSGVEGLIGKAHPIVRQLAITIDSVGFNIADHLVLNGGVLWPQLPNGLGSYRCGCVNSLCNVLVLTRLGGDFMVYAKPEPTSTSGQNTSD